MTKAAKKFPEFTAEMKKTHTILVPNMAKIHFGLLRNVFVRMGYKMEILSYTGREVTDAGLKYVHNDICYPALLVIGQFIYALQSGDYDPKKTALMITQTGGGCRASNYIFLLRKALEKAGFGYVPVISLSLAGLERSEGFKLTPAVLHTAVAALAYGDLLLSLKNQTLPYQINKGQTEKEVLRFTDLLSDLLAKGKGNSLREIKSLSYKIAAAFDKIPVTPKNKIKVGVVGEIYVKYSPLGNNNLEDFLIGQGCEVCLPGILGFGYYMAQNCITQRKLYGAGLFPALGGFLGKKYLLKLQKILKDSVADCKNLTWYDNFENTEKLAGKIIGPGCKMGEGWLLPGEMAELIHNGFSNIVCAQPFGCLPNHIVGKGVIRTIKKLFPKSNIVPIDYDAGATVVNQENRIKLMLAVASENAVTKSN